MSHRPTVFLYFGLLNFSLLFSFSNLPFPFQRCVGNAARLCPARSQQSEPWINSSTPTVSVAWAVIAPCRVCSSMTGMAPLSVKTVTWWANTNKLSEWSELHITQSLVHERDEMIKRKDQKLKPKDNLLTKHFELCLFLNQDTTQYFLFEKWLDFKVFHVYCLLILTGKMYLHLSCIFSLFCPLEFPGCVFPMWREDHRSCAEGSWPMFPCSLFPLQHLFLRTRGCAFHHWWQQQPLLCPGLPQVDTKYFFLSDKQKHFNNYCM